jgi:hypothetical protein
MELREELNLLLNTYLISEGEIYGKDQVVNHLFEMFIKQSASKKDILLVCLN